MEPIMMMSAIFAVINSGLLLGLLYIYAKIAMRSRAVFSVGLMFFALLLLLQNLMTVFAYITMSPFFGSEALPFLLATGVLEFGGLIALLRVTV